MSNPLHPYLESLQQRRRQRFAAETRSLGLLSRLDPVLGPVLLLSAATMLCGWIAVVIVGERYGFFDPDLVRPLPDERKLVNIRDQLATRPYLAAVLHQPEHRLYLLQAGGQIHSYDPDTELWSSEQPVVTSGELVTMRSGCGTDPLSHHQECADPDSIWALTDRGGLVRRSAGSWQLVVGDSTFASGGTQPSSTDLTTAALSADGRWLLVGTASSGVGLYWTEQRTWVPLPAEVNASLPSPRITHLCWWQDRFWCGGPEGLGYVIPDLAKSEAGSYELIRGPILDLDAGARLLVLEQQECDNDSTQSCINLRALTYPDSPPAVLIDERNRFAELDLADLSFAHQNGDFLTVAGEAGLYAYSTRLHSWYRHKKLPILATYADPASNIVYAGFNGGVLGLRNNLVAISWKLTDQRIERLQPGRSGEVLAQASSGQIWSLAVDGKAESLLDGSATSLDPSGFTRAVAAGDDVVMVGHQGALVHNIRNRSYHDLGSDQIPSWLRDPHIRLAGSRSAVFGIPENGGTVLVATVKQLLQGGFEEHNRRLQGPLTTVGDWQGSLLIISGGQVLELRHGASRPLTGSAEPEMDRLTVNDVAVRREDLVVATDRGVRKYSLNSRSWEPWLGRELGPVPIVEVEALGSSDRDLVARTGDNRLVRFGQGDRIVVGEAPGFRFAITDQGLSDVMRRRSSIYLGGDGVVAHYDLEGRRMTEQNRLFGATGDVDLIDQVSGQPLCLADQRAYLGAQPLDPQAGPITDLFTDESSVWTLRESPTGRFLKAYSRSKQLASAPFRCLFRNPVAMSAGARVLDAVEIRSGLIVVATSAGLKLYNHAARSWFAIELEGTDLGPMLKEPDLRLRRLGSWLAILGDKHLTLIPIYLMVEQSSCSTRAISVPGEQVQSFQVKAAAVDGSSQNLVWIGNDGAILRWNGDKPDQVRAPHPPGAPDLADLRRVYRSGERLLLTSANRIWIYDLSSLSWIEHRIEMPEGEGRTLSDMNIEELIADSGLTIRTVTAQTQDGAFYIGTMESIKRVTTLEQLLGPASQRQPFGYPGESILDIQPFGDRWAFVLDDRVRVLDPRSHEWIDEIAFAEPDTTTTLTQVGWRTVVKRQAGREWWIKRRVELAGERYVRFFVERPEQTAIGADGTIWQLQPDGSLHSWSPDSRESRVEIAGDSDPVQALELAGSGTRLTARRGNDSQILAERAWRSPQQGPALNVGWLVWHRDPDQPWLSIRTGDGSQQRLSPAELVQDRQMLFDDIRAVLATQPNRIFAASRFGIFEHRSNLALDSQLVRFYPVPLGDEISAAHGRFLTPVQSLPAGTSNPQDAYHYHQVQVGKQIVLREATREQRISGGLLIPHGLPVRFTTGRFPWEEPKGIAFQSSELYLLTGAGVHPPLSGAADLELDPGPNRSALRGGTIRTGRDGGLYYHDGTTWYRRDQSWLPMTDTAAASAGLLTNASVTGNGDQVVIELPQGKPGRLTLRLGSHGWEGERLQAATTCNNRLHVMTERTHEIAEDVVAFTQGDTERLPAAPTNHLRSISLGPRQSDTLFRWQAGSLTRWSPETKTFVGAQDPRQRVLLELGRLRFRGEVRRGRLQIIKELLVDSPIIEETSWKPFSFSSQGLPIDDVRGIEALDSGLFLLSGIGTSESSYGLQVYADKDHVSPAYHPDAFYDLGRLRSPPRIYQLATDPDRVVVRSGGSCYEWRANFTKLWPCFEGTGNDRWLGENDLWRWVERAGMIEGRYKSNGTVTAAQVDLMRGRFPHDRLRTAMVCNEQTVSLWENGWITNHSAGDRRDLAVTHSNHLQGPIAADELLCVDQAIPFEGGEVTAGVHVTDRSRQRFWRIDDGRLEPINDPLAVSKLSRLDSAPMVLRAGRLRMGPRHPSLGFRFEYRTSTGEWVPLRWIDGKVSIDQVRHMVADGDNLWAATPEGLVSFERDEESGKVSLDPAKLRVIRDIMCDISDIEYYQGMMRVRCDHDSSQVYQADIHSDLDAGAFQAMPSDPFAERLLVATDYWEWHRSGSGGPASSFIEALYNDEPLGLSGGRFDFDGINSVALLNEDRIDVSTAGGGWYVASADLGPGELRRPEVSLIGSFPPQEVMQVGITWQEGQRLLYAVEADASNALLFSESELVGSSQSWPEYLGGDGVWSYAQQDGRLQVTAPGHAGGVARRDLVDGRFTDDVVSGVPAAAQDETGLFYLVPTTAGALRFDASGSPTSVYALQGDDAEAIQGPEAVLVDDQGRLLALYRNKLLSLDEPGVEVAEVEDLAEPDAIITSIEHGPAETIRVRWRVGRRPGWTLYRRHQDQLLAIAKSTLFADASRWRKFVAGQVAWGSPSPLIEISLQPRQILVSHRERNLIYNIDWPRELQPMAAVLDQDRLILVERAGINEVHLGMAVSRLFNSPITQE